VEVVRGLAVVKTIGVAVRVASRAVAVIESARRLEPSRFRRPHPVRWLRSGSLDRRMAPYSATDDYLPLDRTVR
jgi:hypothetical protein